MASAYFLTSVFLQRSYGARTQRVTSTPASGCCSKDLTVGVHVSQFEHEVA
jgi:hypothetical protein